MTIEKLLKLAKILAALASIAQGLEKKLKEVLAPGFDPDTIDLKKLREEIAGLPDLPVQ